VNSRPVDSLVAGPPRRGSDSPSSFERALAVSTAIGSWESSRSATPAQILYDLRPGGGRPGLRVWEWRLLHDVVDLLGDLVEC